MNINLERQRVYIPCPRCNFWTRPFFRQIRHRETIICGGCKSNIRLDDHLGSFRKAQRQVSVALQTVQNSLRDLTINIRL
jgi:hypothetical protein